MPGQLRDPTGAAVAAAAGSASIDRRCLLRSGRLSTIRGRWTV